MDYALLPLGEPGEESQPNAPTAMPPRYCATTSSQLSLVSAHQADVKLQSTQLVVLLNPCRTIIASLNWIFPTLSTVCTATSCWKQCWRKFLVYNKFCYLSYNKPSELVYSGHTIYSKEGPQQGDPLGPLLFCGHHQQIIAFIGLQTQTGLHGRRYARRI